MTLRRRANTILAVIIVGGAVVVTGLHFFAEGGQWLPASMTNDATKSDQRDAVVSNDVANHRK